MIWVGVSHDMPVYSPAVAGYSFQPRQAQAEWVWVPGFAPRWFTRPEMVTNLGTNRA